MKTGLTFVAATLCLITTTRADDAAAYKKAVRSVVGIVCTAPDGQVYGGTGVVLNTNKAATDGEVLRVSLVATAEHVVSSGGTIDILFPLYDSKGEVVGDRESYTGRGRRARIMLSSHDRDLALISVVHTEPVESINPSLDPSPGEHAFAIGAGSGVLFHYASGAVRQAYVGTYKTKVSRVHAKLLDLTIPLNPGDSGGPVFSNAGTLLGINLATETTSNQVHKALAYSEIHAFLKEIIRDYDGVYKQQAKPGVPIQGRTP